MREVLMAYTDPDTGLWAEFEDVIPDAVTADSDPCEALADFTRSHVAKIVRSPQPITDVDDLVAVVVLSFTVAWKYPRRPTEDSIDDRQRALIDLLGLDRRCPAAFEEYREHVRQTARKAAHEELARLEQKRAVCPKCGKSKCDKPKVIGANICPGADPFAAIADAVKVMTIDLMHREDAGRLLEPDEAEEKILDAFDKGCDLKPFPLVEGQQVSASLAEQFATIMGFLGVDRQCPVTISMLLDQARLSAGRTAKFEKLRRKAS